MDNTQSLRGRHILLGVTGGIAAYKACLLLRALQESGASVQVVMTDAATKFVTPMTFQALSGRPVYTDAWSPVVPNHMPHIELAREADAVVVAPATADFMSLLAHGRTPDLLSSLCLARDVPLFVAPAMNRQMWTHPATQANAQALRDQGVVLLGPASGHQACGETGEGRMLEPQEILLGLAQAMVHLAPRHRPSPIRGLLQGRRVLMTAGPTAEPIDPVRVISNRSSGQMGYAIAEAAVEAGATVVLISGPTALACPEGVVRIAVETALEMEAAVSAQLRAWAGDAGPNGPSTDVFIGVAAVADWRPETPLPSKMKKGETGPQFAELRWVENPDILAGVAAAQSLPRPACVVGFAAETCSEAELIDLLPAKRQRKGADLLVGNLAQQALGSDHNRTWLCTEAGVVPLADGPKSEVARRLISTIASQPSLAP